MGTRGLLHVWTVKPNDLSTEKIMNQQEHTHSGYNTRGSKGKTEGGEVVQA